MTYDRASKQGSSWPIPTQEYLLTCVTQRSQALLPQRQGRPASLSNMHLCLGIVLCGLRGLGAQLALCR